MEWAFGQTLEQVEVLGMEENSPSWSAEEKSKVKSAFLFDSVESPRKNSLLQVHLEMVTDEAETSCRVKC